MIPKIIHQIFYPIYLNEIPEEWKKHITLWKQMHPSWGHKFWDIDESRLFLEKEYPWFLNTWLNYKYPIQKCDSIRYFILYHYGGLYVDLDEYPLRPFDNLLEYNVLLAESIFSTIELSNYLMASIPNHPFMKMCIDELQNTTNKYKLFGSHLHIMYSTGPSFLTNVYHKYINNNPNDIFIISSNNLKGIGGYCNEGKHIQGYLLGNDKGKTWNKLDTKIISHLYCNRYFYITCFILIIFSLLLFLLKSYYRCI